MKMGHKICSTHGIYEKYVQYLVRKPNMTNTAHKVKSYFFKIHFNIILPSTPMSPTWSIPLGSPTKIFYALHIFSMHAFTE